MDLPRILERLGIVENVASDLSSYESMISTWRSKLKMPSLKECEEAQAKFKDEPQIANQDKLSALWEAAVNQNTKPLEKLKAQIATQNLEKPK